MSFQFGESHFNPLAGRRIEVRAVRRQIQEPATGIFQSLGGILVAMRREVVTDHDGSRRQFRRKDFPDVCDENSSVHRPFDQLPLERH